MHNNGQLDAGLILRCAGFSRVTSVLLFWNFLATPALALDLNSFRAQHGRPALSVSSTLSALAYEQAHSMAGHDISS
jgi:hypothetical protein